MRFVAESAALGLATVPELVRETDPDVLLAIQAATAPALELLDARFKRLAQHIAAEVSKLL